MPQIHTVTLNPAIDRILYLKKFQPEVTNRLTGDMTGLGGKGTHVSINLAILGIDSQAFGIVHGEDGEKILRMLREAGAAVKFLHFSQENSRTNYLLIEDDGKCTCLSARGVSLSEENIAELIRLMEESVREGDYLVLSGDASNCPDPFVYNTIMDALAKKKLKVFLDASGEALKRCVRCRPYLIKPNRDELSCLCGRELRSEEEIAGAIRELSAEGIPVIAVSLGGDGSMVCENGQIYRVTPPDVNVCNTIGCGDSFLSGLVFGKYKNLPMEETLKIATAVSAATAEEKNSVGFDRGRARELYDAVSVTKWKG